MISINARILNKKRMDVALQRIHIGGTTPSGIIYQRHPKLYATVSKYNYDYTYYLMTGAFDYDPPLYAEYRQELDINDLRKLQHPNIHGNYDRFTDTQGGQTYSDGWVQDHLTGIEYYYETRQRRWDIAVNSVESLEINGRVGRPASISELHTLTNVGVYGSETFTHVPYFNTLIDINNIIIIAGCSFDMRGWPQGIFGKIANSSNYGIIGYQWNRVYANFMFARRIEEPLNTY